MRYDEQQGWIKPCRNGSNHRIYSLKDIQRLKKVKQLHLSGNQHYRNKSNLERYRSIYSRLDHCTSSVNESP
ncbi:MerR family transcriptional regulator [Melghiribacillus thermohalophilus]|uniref:MerR family transcriptional regulator n=1 Tax=Melghiribacillus thermohalophilus TaxID=1324956 RepID=UPI003C72433C